MKDLQLNDVILVQLYIQEVRRGHYYPTEGYIYSQPPGYTFETEFHKYSNEGINEVHKPLLLPGLVIPEAPQEEKSIPLVLHDIPLDKLKELHYGKSTMCPVTFTHYSHLPSYDSSLQRTDIPEPRSPKQPEQHLGPPQDKNIFFLKSPFFPKLGWRS
ncbi:hypothetical protein JTB14_000251 [Gonioctena quinquepunctata]|nr:hypothetical protein JTB14_000251 [Gonioctena quinquepunctata]